MKRENKMMKKFEEDVVIEDDVPDTTRVIKPAAVNAEKAKPSTASLFVGGSANPTNTSSHENAFGDDDDGEELGPFGRGIPPMLVSPTAKAASVEDEDSEATKQKQKQKKKSKNTKKQESEDRDEEEDEEDEDEKPKGHRPKFDELDTEPDEPAVVPKKASVPVVKGADPLADFLGDEEAPVHRITAGPTFDDKENPVDSDEEVVAPVKAKAKVGGKIASPAPVAPAAPVARNVLDDFFGGDDDASVS